LVVPNGGDGGLVVESIIVVYYTFCLVVFFGKQPQRKKRLKQEGAHRAKKMKNMINPKSSSVKFRV